MLKTTSFDPAAYLDNPETCAAYLSAALSEGPSAFLDALGDVARAKGMTDIARKIGVARPALYRSIGANGHPEFATVVHVLNEVGVRFAIEPPPRPRRSRIRRTLETA